MKKIWLIFSLMMAGFVYAQSAVISDFEFSGLKRTKESYIEKVLNKYKGLPFSEDVASNIEEDLRNMGLFSKIEIKDVTSESSTTVHITLKEKISFVVLPFGSYTNDGPMGGVAMLDQNAFGIRDTLLLGGTIAKDSYSVMSSFRQPAIDLTHPGFSVSATYSKRKEKIESLDSDTLYKIDLHRIFFEIALIEKFTPNFTASAGVSYTGSIFVEDGLDNIHQILFHPRLNYSVSDWNGVFTSEKSFEVSANVGATTDGKFVTTQKVEALIQQPIAQRVRLILATCISNEYNKDVINQQTRSGVSTNLLPSNFHSPRMLSSNFALEVATFQTKFAMLSVSGAYQIVLVKDYDDKTDFSYGPGASLKVYLSTINLPACGVGLYYNVPHESFEFGVSMGVSF